MNKKGLFITFEGPDGSGKSTVIASVYEILKNNRHQFGICITREPGGKNNAIAEDIRHILLNKIEYQISARAEALLFAASRAQHVKDFIQPNLVKGNLVLCDRYIHSSLVYQGYARKLGIKEV
jgi:dTMP kinase